jgi:carbonyl reductase 1
LNNPLLFCLPSDRSVQRGDHPEYGWPKKNWVSYVASKIAVSAMTRIQQRDFDADPRPDIIANHVHPGYVKTKMASFKGVLTIEEGKLPIANNNA